MTDRRGVLAGGNFIVDHVKIVDTYPEKEMLARISSESMSNGGGPYNVLTDLARLGADAPLEAVGLVGDDSNGQWVVEDCQASGIKTTQLHRTSKASTSYTDVMSVAGGGPRTFFHQSGANALLGPEHFDFSVTNARLFHLAYLFLLDRMDECGDDGRSAASHVLESARSHGLSTSADLVSLPHPKATELVTSAAPWLDYLLLNEVEAARVVDRPLRSADNRPIVDEIAAASAQLLGLGVREEVVIHFAEGAVCCNVDTGVHLQGAVSLPEGYNQGSVGAGDAFAAGYLWGVHESIDSPTRLRWSVCAAGMSLSHPTPSLGMRTLAQCLTLGAQFGFNNEIEFPPPLEAL